MPLSWQNGQFWMLLLFTLFVTQITTYDQQFAQYFSLQFPTPRKANAADPRLFRSAVKPVPLPDAMVC